MWTFCGEHPFAAFFIALAVVGAIENVAASIGGAIAARGKPPRKSSRD